MRIHGVKPEQDSLYIYTVYLSGELVYVGRGIGNRYLHVTSGTSHCYEANRAHFIEPENVHVEIHSFYSTQCEVNTEEERLIKTLKPIWNKQLVKCGEYSEVVQAVRALPTDDRVLLDVVASVLEVEPMSVSTYIDVMGIGGAAYRYYSDILNGLGLKFITAFSDTATKAAAKDNRLQTVTNILLDKKNKVAAMPELFTKHGITKPTFDRYKREFKSELQSLGLIKVGK